MSHESPTEIRLSDHFLLSDLMGCHSVYAKGYANVFDVRDRAKLREGTFFLTKMRNGGTGEVDFRYSIGFTSFEEVSSC